MIPPTAPMPLVAFHADGATLGSLGLALGGVLFTTLTQTNGGVVFGPGEIAVVGGIVSSVVGGMTVLFRLLLAAKDDTIKRERERADRMERIAMRNLGLAEVATETARTSRELLP
jgi:hypothetical protein